ncbi:hypothetical protein [Brevibacillus thermoruber]|jgi:8-oxo-dGTP diphosphatase|uniref:Uncharacterized protein n=1 Tax=Brevibacillus thermoruber TaxID=33942 RepID=A0A9X3TTR0_9BACL|nr:hypothetical protein [Brevibacillus thermoruber]MDA5110774.1 hypothetical protein [Brevibacillus thermoruber]
MSAGSYGRRRERIAEAAFLPIRRLLDDPLAAIILSRFTAREQGLAGREYGIEPVFQYTRYKIFSHS